MDRYERVNQAEPHPTKKPSHWDLDHAVQTQAVRTLHSMGLNQAALALKARMAMGIEKYGDLVYPHNGRCAAIDAAQECLDCLVYCMQGAMEGKQTFEQFRTLALALAPFIDQGLEAATEDPQVQNDEAVDGKAVVGSKLANQPYLPGEGSGIPDPGGLT